MPTKNDEISPALDEHCVRRSLRLNVIAGIFGIVFWWTVSPNVIQLFALQLGAENFHIAVISAIIFITLPAQLLSSFLVEKYRTRKSLWMWSSVIARSMWIPIILMPFFLNGMSLNSRLWYLIIFLFMYYAVINSTVAPWFSWMTDIVPKERSGQFWGRRFGYISLASVLMLPLVGMFLDWRIFPEDSITPFVLLIAFGLIGGFIDVFLHRGISDPGMVENREKTDFRKLLIAPFTDKPFRRFLAAMSYYTIVMLIYRPFIVVFLKRNFGMGHLPILMLSVSALFGSLLVSRMWGFLSDHFGLKPVMKILFLGHAFLPLVLIFTTANTHPTWRLVVLYFAWFVDCCFAAGVLIVQQTFFSSSLPRKNRSMYIAGFYSAIGLFAAAAPLLGGLLLKLFDMLDLSVISTSLTSYHLLFALGMVLTLPSMAFVGRLICKESMSPRKVFGQVLFGRVLGISRWLSILDQSTSEKRRLKSLDKIEKIKNPLASCNLGKHLHDPSEKVREKARQTLETLSIEEEARKVFPMVKHISDARLRKTIRRDLRHPNNLVKKNAVEKIRTVTRKAA